MAKDLGNEVEPFARKAKTLLAKVNKELATIPEYKNADSLAGKSDREPKRSDLIADAITAARRGIRLLKGKESKPSLKKKKQRLESFLKTAEEYKGATFIEGASGKSLLLK